MLHVQGRRRPFVAVGTLVAVVALTIMALTTSLELYSFAFLLLSVANNLIISPVSALLPDVIPADARGAPARRPLLCCREAHGVSSVLKALRPAGWAP